MVDRFTITAAEQDPWVDADPSGQWVRYSDYAALEAQLAEKVRVKPLEWRTSADGKMFAITPVGLGYSVFGSPLGDTWLLELQCGSVVTAEAHSSEEEAIGYAQADYERRIRSALEATPAPMVTFPGCVVSLNGTKISMAFETDEDAQTVFRLIDHIIDSTASEAKQ